MFRVYGWKSLFTLWSHSAVSECRNILFEHSTIAFYGDPELHKIDKNEKTTRGTDTRRIVLHLQTEPVILVFERYLYLERSRSLYVFNLLVLKQRIIIITRLHSHRKCWKRACLLGPKTKMECLRPLVHEILKKKQLALAWLACCYDPPKQKWSLYDVWFKRYSRKTD